MASGNEDVPKTSTEGDVGPERSAPPTAEDPSVDPALREQFREVAEALAAVDARKVELLYEIIANQGRVIANLEEQMCALKIHLFLLRQGRN